MREAVEAVLTGRKAARTVGHQFIMDDAKLRAAGFSYDEIHAIRSHVLEIEDMLTARMSKIEANDK
jgi:hypothetical protein